MMKKILFALISLMAVSCIFSDDNTVVIPKPVKVEEFAGIFQISEKTKIVPLSEELISVAEIAANDCRNQLGYPLEMSRGRGLRGDILLELSNMMEQEEYMLDVTEESVLVQGGSPAAVFYGLQTFRQLLDGSGAAGAVRIYDKPHFAYRGTLLDVSRHFFTVEEVKKFIDIIVMHKINRLHLHLTDDQGWRIEIKKYPLLTEIGSMRKQTVVGKNSADNNNYDGIPHGGFYTQDEIRDIVKYAADRFVTIVPEIDLPGHMQAALAAYPELGCTGGPYEMRCKWGISEDVLCAGNDEVLRFLEDVIHEVVDLFPSEYIHLGGDECPKTAWENCPKCQARIKQLGLKDDSKYKAEHYLQNYVMSYMEKCLNNHGRKMIGWDEILEGSASETSTIMVWREHSHAVTAVRRGNDVITSLRHYCYLDYCQTSDPESEPLCVTHRYLPMRQVFRLDPYDRLMLHEKSKMLGVQANLWTEYIADFDQVQHMLLPRLAAFAETAWAYDRKGLYEEFEARAKALLPGLYERNGYKYAPYFFDGIE